MKLAEVILECSLKALPQSPVTHCEEPMLHGEATMITLVDRPQSLDSSHGLAPDIPGQKPTEDPLYPDESPLTEAPDLVEQRQAISAGLSLDS